MMSEVGQAFVDAIAELEAHAACAVGQANVRVAVREENRRQLEKWGVQTHSPEYWFGILMEEVGEVAEAISLAGAPDTRPALASYVLTQAYALGKIAKAYVEGIEPDGLTRVRAETDDLDVGKETLHVAAVAVAMEDSRRRNAA